MNKHIKTINDAAHEWVNGFNAIDQGIIADLMAHDIDDWSEITMPCRGDRVYVFRLGEEGEISGYDYITVLGEGDEEQRKYTVSMDSGEMLAFDETEFEVLRDDYLPMWGTMWSFGDSIDDEWPSDHGGLRKVSECGFRVYESQKYGYFFGIDGAGYSFYESHWIPLYKARGLKWHDEETDN